jgi:hypothetical protein
VDNNGQLASKEAEAARGSRPSISEISETTLSINGMTRLTSSDLTTTLLSFVKETGQHQHLTSEVLGKMPIKAPPRSGQSSKTYAGAGRTTASSSTGGKKLSSLSSVS